MEIELEDTRFLNDLQKWGIVCFKTYTDDSERKIAETIGTSQLNVNKIFRKQQETGSVKNLTINNGRKSQFQEMEEDIQDVADEYNYDNKIYKASDFQVIVKDDLGIEISEQTSKRWLSKLGYSKKPVKIYQEITAETKKQRIKYAKKQRKQTLNKTFFRDEVALKLNDNIYKIWRKNDEEREVFQKQLQWKQSFMIVWGAISQYGKSDLYVFIYITTRARAIEALNQIWNQDISLDFFRSCILNLKEKFDLAIQNDGGFYIS